VSQPLDCLEQQAKAVKVLRSTVELVLGVMDTESDKLLIKLFDETIERAFAPCSSPL